MSDLFFRFGRPEERQALEDLQRRASLIYEEDRPHLLANPEAIHLPLSQLVERFVRVAEREGQMLGFSVVLCRTAEICDLDGLFVEPDQWKHGIGRALIADAVSCAMTDGAQVMEVRANPRALGFYQKSGFICFGTEQMQFGLAHLMRYEIR